MMKRLFSNTEKLRMKYSRDLNGKHLGVLLTDEETHPGKSILFTEKAWFFFKEGRVVVYRADHLTKEQKSIWLYILPYLVMDKNTIDKDVMVAIDKGFDLSSSLICGLIYQIALREGKWIYDNMSITVKA